MRCVFAEMGLATESKRIRAAVLAPIADQESPALTRVLE